MCTHVSGRHTHMYVQTACACTRVFTYTPIGLCAQCMHGHVCAHSTYTHMCTHCTPAHVCVCVSVAHTCARTPIGLHARGTRRGHTHIRVRICSHVRVHSVQCAHSPVRVYVHAGAVHLCTLSPLLVSTSTGVHRMRCVHSYPCTSRCGTRVPWVPSLKKSGKRAKKKKKIHREKSQPPIRNYNSHHPPRGRAARDKGAGLPLSPAPQPSPHWLRRRCRW